MNLTEIKINIEEYPQKIHHLLTDAKIYDSSCHSDAKVIYSDKGYFIKTAKAGNLEKEAKMAKIFYDAGLGVELTEFISDDMDCMVTKEADGEDLTHFTDSAEYVCETLAKAAKQLHGVTIDDIGISDAHRIYKNIDVNGKEAKITEFIRFMGISSTEEAVDTIKKHMDKMKCDTLIHGDMCLPNIIVNNEGKMTFIDTALAGMGDKHIDIYWAMWTLWFNLKNTAPSEYFLTLYGKENIDPDTLKLIAAIESLM